MTTNPDNARRVVLEDPTERWALREGYLTRMSVSWNTDSTTTSSYFTSHELQTIVNAAAVQYGIRPECTCGLTVVDPDCPAHKGRELSAGLRDLDAAQLRAAYEAGSSRNIPDFETWMEARK